MNKAAIKNFAILARVQLIEAAKQRAYEYGITENGENKTGLDMVGGKLLTKTEKEQRNQLISEINRKGYTQVMEEAAYTWFNRFIALRYMEVNGFLPSKVRLFTDETGAFKPEILKEAMTVEIDGLDRAKVLDLLDKQNNEELYKYLLITQCNALNQGLPYMFEKISNWTELLFPANLLRPDSVVGQMVSEIPEEDWQDAVQIIGWLYQYYNTELKDDTFAQLKKNVKITKERIPAATQLFTPDWIVRYMVENSLGRLWLEGHPNAELRGGWKYYLDEAEQEPEVEAQLSKLREEYKNIKPEEIKIIDPCMGSGHILVYAFDVLMQIYTSAGWSERDAAKSIIENNLFGLDIDDRAGQLAYFAVMMKARKHNRRILNGGITPNVLAIQESGWMTDDFIAYVANGSADLKAALVILRNTFKEAKEYGSILNVPMLNFDALLERIDAIEKSDTENLFHIQYRDMTAELLAPLVKQAKIMAPKYDVVCTNPPYMGASNMSTKLSDFVKSKYPDSKSDLFAVFIERCGQMAKKNGYQAMITQHAWMFLSSFEKLRTKLLTVDIVNMAHLGARAFEEIGGEVVQTTSFVIRKSHIADYKGEYCRLIEPTTQQGKEDMFLAGENRYAADQSNFSKIPGSPVAYWVSSAFINAFSTGTQLGCDFRASEGIKTGDNERFLRHWYEIASTDFSFSELDFSKKWYPHHKGGDYRKWYGNLVWAVYWENNGEEIRKNKNSGLQGKDMYFKPNLGWSKISSRDNPVRFYPGGTLFDSMAPSICGDRNLLYLVALLNTHVAYEYLHILNPTLALQVGDMRNMPVIYKNITSVSAISDNSIEISKADWDSYETSWDFKRNPLV